MTNKFDRIHTNTNKKYIVRNCPAYCYLGKECHSREGQYGASCCEVTDCVMKQIVEKCKEEIKVYRNTLLPNDGTNTLHFGRQSFAYDILQMLDIQEVE